MIRAGRVAQLRFTAAVAHALTDDDGIVQRAELAIARRKAWIGDDLTAKQHGGWIPEFHLRLEFRYERDIRAPSWAHFCDRFGIQGQRGL